MGKHLREVLSYFLAVLAAGANAASNILQRKANREAAPDLSMSPRLVGELIRRPAWLGGFVAVIVSFLLMAAALATGRLTAVQPIVVAELPLTLVAAAKVFGARLTVREGVAAGGMTLGLAGLIGFLAPVGGDQGRAPGMDWLLATSATVALIVAILVAALWRTSPRSGARRPALLGVATGVAFGLTAAFMKGMTAAYHGGVVGVLTSWQTYAMATSGLAAMFLLQNAFHAGRLLVVQPGITLADPAAAMAWGVFVFHERTRGGVFLALAVLSGLLIAAATVVLAGSPLLDERGAARERVAAR